MWMRKLWGILLLPVENWIPWTHSLCTAFRPKDAICLIIYKQCLEGKYFNESFLIDWLLNQFWKSPAKHDSKYILNLENISLHIPKKMVSTS